MLELLLHMRTNEFVEKLNKLLEPLHQGTLMLIAVNFIEFPHFPPFPNCNLNFNNSIDVELGEQQESTA